MAAQRPERPCAECAKMTTSKDRICRKCKTPAQGHAGTKPSPADALRDGYWSPGPVRRWVSTREAV